MKPIPLLFGLLGIAAGAMGALSAEDDWTVIISGDIDGYLSPCGCTAPMSGGIRRRASYIDSIQNRERLIVLDNGGFVASAGRQDEMKAQTMAQALAAMRADAINLTPAEAALGRGILNSIATLAEGKLVATQLSGPALGTERWKERGPFLVGGITSKPSALGQLGVAPQPVGTAVTELIEEADRRGRHAAVLFNGSLSEARTLAETFPQLALIVYRSQGDPPITAEKIGNTVVVTPGDKGRSIVRLSFGKGGLTAYAPVGLGPEYPDDPEVSRFYASYLQRVEGANLLDRAPRTPGPDYAGNKACGSCHATAYNVWKGSEHAHALATLEKDGHGRDPDCVGCHVVGLEHEKGFTSRENTPDLTDVGCESCHGGGKAHAIAPKLNPMPIVGAKSCAPCHTPNQSPNFSFLTYWAKIKH